jgi:hypothetical protein
MPFDRVLIRDLSPMILVSSNAIALSRLNPGCDAATYSMSCPTFIQRGSTATSAIKQARFMTSWRRLNGSTPSTSSRPSKEVNPSMALSAVVLPAPLRPISPTIRPGSTDKSIPSRARTGP